jgi:putative hydrolase of the HAD superfamily
MARPGKEKDTGLDGRRLRLGRERSGPGAEAVSVGRQPAPRESDIRAVTFDLGGTLIEPWPSVGHLYAEVAARHGWRDLSARQLNRRFAAAWHARPDFEHTRAAWSELVDLTFEGLTDRPPSRTFFAELYERFNEVDAWRVFEDVVPALEALAGRGVKLGVISNWDERLRPLLLKLKLTDYFAAIVISSEVGCSKPSRVIFERAIQRLGMGAEAILHVGDSLAMDVRGARAAGLHALRLRRQGLAAQPGQIRSLRELY